MDISLFRGDCKCSYWALYVLLSHLCFIVILWAWLWANKLIDWLIDVWKSHIRVDTKVRLYQTYVLLVLVYGSQGWTITKALARRLDASNTRSLRKILLIPYTRHVIIASVRETIGCHPVSSIIKTRRSTSLATRLVHIPGKIINELSVRRSDYQGSGEDLKGARVPPGWGGLKLMYSRLTSVFIHPGGRSTTVFSGDAYHRYGNTPLGALHRRRRRMQKRCRLY